VLLEVVRVLVVVGLINFRVGNVRNLFGSIFTIEQRGGFFKGTVLGLNDVEVEEDNLEADPTAVDNVVLPGDVIKSNGVDVLVENEGEGNGEVEDSETLCTYGEGQDLHGIGDDEGSEREIVRGVEQENECDDSVGRILVAV